MALRFPKTFPRKFELTLRPSVLDLPVHWRRPRTIFVNSMSDLFHADVPESYIAQVDIWVDFHQVRSPRVGGMVFAAKSAYFRIEQLSAASAENR